MKKKLILLTMCCMVFGLAACGSKDEKEGEWLVKPDYDACAVSITRLK